MRRGGRLLLGLTGATGDTGAVTMRRGGRLRLGLTGAIGDTGAAMIRRDAITTGGGTTSIATAVGAILLGGKPRLGLLGAAIGILIGAGRMRRGGLIGAALFIPIRLGSTRRGEAGLVILLLTLEVVSV